MTAQTPEELRAAVARPGWPAHKPAQITAALVKARNCTFEIPTNANDTVTTGLDDLRIAISFGLGSPARLDDRYARRLAKGVRDEIRGGIRRVRFDALASDRHTAISEAFNRLEKAANHIVVWHHGPPITVAPPPGSPSATTLPSAHRGPVPVVDVRPVKAVLTTTVQSVLDASALGRDFAYAASDLRLLIDQSPVAELFDWLGAIVYGLLAGADQPQPPTVAVTPTDDERIEFERVWGLVERAADSGLLDVELENEIRVLNKILGTVRNELDPDRYADLFDLVSSKVATLLPGIIAALLPAGTPPPASVTAVAAGVAPQAQLDAMATDLGNAADTLSTVADKIADESDRPDDVEPPLVAYGDETIEKINRSFTRIDLAYAKLQTTKTGKFVLRTVGTGVGAAVTAVGLATADLVSAHQATVIATTVSWLYTRLRRALTSLPARNRVPLEPDDD